MLVLLCFIFCLHSRTIAQDADTDMDIYTPRQLRNTGKKAMLQGDYTTASIYFEQYLKNKSNKYKIAYQLAESYRKNRDYENAEKWYKRAFDKSDKKEALAMYYYALMLKINGDCNKSKECFLKFNTLASGRKELDFYKKQLKIEMAGCDLLAKQDSISSAKIKVMHLDTSINKAHVEHAPLMIDSSTIIYASLRTDKEAYRYLHPDSVNNNVRKFYKAIRSDSNWVFAGELDGPFNTPLMNTTNGTLSVDGRRFYFTRCETDLKNKNICSVFVSERKDDNTWTEPKKLDEKINLPGYTSTQPAAALVKEDEIVYFVSDRPNGRGGLDIWYFIYDLKRKTYSIPNNVGEKINSANDEITPYYDMETHSLFFSSNGWIGMGGFDIVKSKGEKKEFSAVENIGSPVNSTFDDIYYSEGMSGEDGFFVSNRKGGVNISKNVCSDDIYSFKRLEYVKRKVERFVFVPKKEEKDTLSKNAIAPVETTDSIASKPVLVKKMPVDVLVKDTIALVSPSGKEKDSSLKEIIAPVAIKDSIVSKPVIVKKVPVDELVKDTIALVSPSGKEKDSSLKEIIAPVAIDSIVSKPVIVKKVSVDELVKDTIALASPSDKEKERNASLKNVIVSEITDSALKPMLLKKNLSTKKSAKDTVAHSGDKSVIKSDTTAIVRAKNITPPAQTIQKDSSLAKQSSSIVIKNIYYEFNKAELTLNSKIVIDTTLLIILQENPTLKIKISSHADNKGSDVYNLHLSQRRAKNVIAYLISKGINKNRMVAKGYGETNPIVPNQNPDGSDNPEGREKNRRTEFKVTDK